MKVVPRRVEAAVGGALLHKVGQSMVKASALVAKQITLSDGLAVHYYEKEGDGPSLLLLHGYTDEAKNLAAFVALLKKQLPGWRIIVPDLIGHGKDLERAKKEGSGFRYPTPQRLLDSVVGFAQALELKECAVFGISLGGGLAYFLQEQHPKVFRKAILINPALESVVDAQFIDDFEQGRKNHFCIQSRDDVKHLFRDLSCPHRKKKNPVPKFLLEAIWQDRLKREPSDHFRNYFERLLQERGKDPEWLGCEKDIAPDAHRLVIWPRNDFIANYEKGRAFFAESTQTTFLSVPDCGHVFHSDGKSIIEHTLPQMVEYLQKDE